MKSIKARPYTARAEAQPALTPNTWKSSIVSVLQNDVEVGSYHRNYAAFANETF